MRLCWNALELWQPKELWAVQGHGFSTAATSPGLNETHRLKTQILREIVFPWRLVSGIQVKSKPSQFQFYTVFQKLIHLPLHLGQAHTSSSTMNSHSMLSQDQHKVGSSSNKSGSWAQLETLLLGRDIQKDLWPKRRFTKRLKLSQQVMFYMELSQLWEPKTVWFIIMFPIKSLSLEYPISPPLETNPCRLALLFWQVPSQNYMRTRPTALLRARRTWPVGSVNVHSGHPSDLFRGNFWPKDH